MKKYLILFGFCSVLFILKLNAQTYPNYQENIPITAFVNTSGGGTFFISIQYNMLTIGNTGSFTPTSINTGLVHHFSTPYAVPNTDLGYIKNSNGQNTSYKIAIQNNWLVISSTTNEILSFININGTYDLTPNNPNDNVPILKSSIPSSNENYIFTMDATLPTTGNLYTLHDASTNTYNLKEGVIPAISYIDGLGRDLLTIAIGQSGDGKDVINHFDYDNLGRLTKEYLPYPSTNQNNGVFISSAQALTELDQYYLQEYSDDLQNGVNPFSEKLFEKSSLNRITKQGAPGSDWKVITGSNTDHTIKFNYGFNTLDLNDNSADNVRFFDVVFPLSYNTERTDLVTRGYYKTNELFKSIVKNENWQPGQQFLKDYTVEEFKDKTEKIILKRTFNENNPHDTYYVYDKFGNLSFVIPPKASDILVTEVPNNQSGIVWQKFYPWVELVEIDKSFADDYNKRLSEYKESEVRNIDLENKYNGEGGFTLIAFNDGTYSVDIDFSSDISFNLRQGSIASFDKQFRIKDAKIGVLNGNNFNYELKITDNSFTIIGTGELNLIDQEYFTLVPNSTVETIDGNIIPSLCYIYHYDKRNRLIEKKVPGKGWEYIVYNKVDQPIMTQDALLRVQHQWLFTKYDIFKRIVYSGQLYYIPNGEQENSGRLELQNYAEQSTELCYESFTLTPSTIENTTVEYSNDSFPDTDKPQFLGAKLFTINYYDNHSYGFPSELTFSSPYSSLLANNNRSLSTGSKVRVLETDQWIYNKAYYDSQGRQIFSGTKNEFLQTLDILRTKLDFAGKVLQTNHSHYRIGNTHIVTIENFIYDSQNRLIAQTTTINGGDNELIASIEYDRLGNLISKNVGGKIVSTPSQAQGLQRVDYKYNIRGWLRQINDPIIPGSDLFNFKINYNTTDLSGSSKLYNGNIYEIHWRTANDNINRNYQFTYDAMNRLIDADYQGGILNFPDNVSMPINQAENYSLKDVSYDKNGNIKHLERYGIHLSYSSSGFNHTIDIVDGLNYFYEDNSNRLMNVTDFADNGYSGNPNTDLDAGGFLEKYEDGDKYEYDINGNLIRDHNKRIQHISYNYLNLPTEIQVKQNDDPISLFDNIKYTYDAKGNKLKKSKEVQGVVDEVVTLYAGSFIYQGTYAYGLELAFFAQPEGYVEPDNSGGFEYIYQYKDHLGNVRLSYSDADGNGVIDASAEIMEENNYYPFGLKHKGYNGNINGTHHPYTFGGKEEQEELGLDWLDFSARNYDAALGRWMNLDPMAEAQYAYSPYHYAYNSPIMYNDPTGMIGEAFTTNVINRDDPSQSIWIDDGYDFDFYVSGDDFAEISSTGAIPKRLNWAWNKEFWRQVLAGVVKSDGSVSDEITAFLITDDINDVGEVITQEAGAGNIIIGAAIAIGAGKLKKLKKLARWVKTKANKGKRIPGTADGGKTFKNDGRNGQPKLPEKDANGNPITYTKYDINKAPQHGATRGNERMIVGSDGKTYYTRNHYDGFVEFKD